MTIRCGTTPSSSRATRLPVRGIAAEDAVADEAPEVSSPRDGVHRDLRDILLARVGTLRRHQRIENLRP